MKPQIGTQAITVVSPRNPSLFKNAALSAVLAMGLTSSSQAVNVAISGVDTQTTGNQPIVNFIQNNFQNATITYGDYSNPANIPVGTEVFMVGRDLFSGAYDNAANTAVFNSLTIPVVAFTSYVTRTSGARWAWESGGVAGASGAGTETIVTAAGSSVFGVAAGTAVDWWSGLTVNFDSAGTGTVGTGHILATIGGNNLAVHWNPGETTAGGATLGGERLLFNIPRDGSSGSVVVPDTMAGQQALIAAISAFTPLVAAPVPEPATSSLVLGGLAMLLVARRRK